MLGRHCEGCSGSRGAGTPVLSPLPPASRALPSARAWLPQVTRGQWGAGAWGDNLSLTPCTVPFISPGVTPHAPSPPVHGGPHGSGVHLRDRSSGTDLCGWEMDPDPSRDWDRGEGSAVGLKGVPSHHCPCRVLQRMWVSWELQGAHKLGPC